MENKEKEVINSISIGGLIVRFITGTIILFITAFFTPEFELSSILILTISAIILTIFDYLINSIFGINTSPFFKGIIGTFVCAMILYFTQFFVSSYSISITSAIIGAIIYGIVASMIPEKDMY